MNTTTPTNASIITFTTTSTTTTFILQVGRNLSTTSTARRRFCYLFKYQHHAPHTKIPTKIALTARLVGKSLAFVV